MIYRRIVIEATGLDEDDLTQHVAAALRELAEANPALLADDESAVGGYTISEERGPVKPPSLEKGVA